MNRNSPWSWVGFSGTVLLLMALMPVLITQSLNVFQGVLGGPAPSTPAPAPAPQPAPAPAAPGPTAGPAGVAIDGTVVTYIVVAIFAITAAAVGIWFTARALKRRRARAEKEAAVRQGEIDRWNRGVAALAETSDALWAFEEDPMSVYITRPLLADTNEPASADFYAAYALAKDLHAETIPDDPAVIDEFVDAAKKAREAFWRADENALRKARRGYTSGGRQFTDAERRKVEQAGKLLNHAFDAGATPQEAKTAHAKALGLLDEAGASVPERLAAKLTLSLEHAHRPALTAGSGA